MKVRLLDCLLWKDGSVVLIFKSDLLYKCMSVSALVGQIVCLHYCILYSVFLFTEYVYTPTLPQRCPISDIRPRKVTTTNTLGTDPSWSTIHTNKKVLYTCTHPSVSMQLTSTKCSD